MGFLWGRPSVKLLSIFLISYASRTTSDLICLRVQLNPGTFLSCSQIMQILGSRYGMPVQRHWNVGIWGNNQQTKERPRPFLKFPARTKDTSASLLNNNNRKVNPLASIPGIPHWPVKLSASIPEIPYLTVSPSASIPEIPCVAACRYKQKKFGSIPEILRIGRQSY